MGGALAIALSRRGYKIDSLVGRELKRISKIARLVNPQPTVGLLDDAEPITSRIVLITTPDLFISDTVTRLKCRLAERGQIVYHTSGSLSSEILIPLAGGATSIGSLHPLVSVSSAAAGADKFSGAYFCVEGQRSAVREGMQICRQLGGKPFSLSSELKPLYHLAAVMSSGHIVALVDTAFSLMAQTGLGLNQARKVLLPLVASTLANLETQDTEDALTGPFPRGDVTVVDRHLNALEKFGARNEIEIYLDLALRSLDIAERQDRRRDLTELRKLILLAKQNFK